MGHQRKDAENFPRFSCAPQNSRRGMGRASGSAEDGLRRVDHLYRQESDIDPIAIRAARPDRIIQTTDRVIAPTISHPTVVVAADLPRKPSARSFRTSTSRDSELFTLSDTDSSPQS